MKQFVIGLLLGDLVSGLVGYLAVIERMPRTAAMLPHIDANAVVIGRRLPPR